MTAAAGSFTISRDQVRDFDALSLEAVGLLAWLTSHTDAYIAALTEDAIRAKVRIGRDKVRRLLRELAAAGYLVRRRLTDLVGLTTGVRYGLNRRARPGEMTLPLDGFSGEPSDLRKNDVSAGRRHDGFSGEHSSSQEEQRSTKGSPVRNTRTRDPEPTPQEQSGASMPSYRQTRLPIIGPRKAGKDDIEPASPGTLARITPQAQTLALMRRLTTTITDEWLSRCLRRPPASVIDGVEAHVYTLICEGIPDDDIRRGMAAWMVKGYAPGAIPSFVNQAMNGRALAVAAEQGPTRRDLRVAATLALGERLQAEADRRAAAS